MPEIMMWVFPAVALLLVLVAFAFGLALFKPWLRAFMTGTPVSIFAILGMRLRGTPPTMVIDAYRQLRTRGRDVRVVDVERQYIAHQHRIRAPGDLVDLVEQQQS